MFAINDGTFGFVDLFIGNEKNTGIMISTLVRSLPLKDLDYINLYSHNTMKHCFTAPCLFSQILAL